MDSVFSFVALLYPKKLFNIFTFFFSDIKKILLLLFFKKKQKDDKQQKQQLLQSQGSQDDPIPLIPLASQHQDSQQQEFGAILSDQQN